MSFTKKIIDLARSNLNALLEKAADTTDPRRRLASVSDADLEAELERRKSSRNAEAKVEDAKARVEGRPSPDRAERERQAKEREARVRAARAAREAQQQQSAPPPPRPRPAPGPGQQRQSPPPRPSQQAELTVYYQRLEIPPGSDWDTVKAAYRKLMRKYHPDLHGGKSPEKLKAATEVSQALTQAYNELEKALRGGPNRR